MRVIVTGSRDWTDREVIRRELAQLPPGTVIIHGAAPGADSIADAMAVELGMIVEPHPAKWGVHEPGWCRCSHRLKAERTYCAMAGHRRNQEMVDAGGDLCIAFPLPGSRGTRDMARRAGAAGMVVLVVELEPYNTDGDCLRGK